MFDEKNRPTPEQVRQKLNEMIVFDNVMAFSLDVKGATEVGKATPMVLSACTIGSPDVLLNGLVNLMEENRFVAAVVIQAADVHREKMNAGGLGDFLAFLQGLQRK